MTDTFGYFWLSPLSLFQTLSKNEVSYPVLKSFGTHKSRLLHNLWILCGNFIFERFLVTLQFKNLLRRHNNLSIRVYNPLRCQPFTHNIKPSRLPQVVISTFQNRNVDKLKRQFRIVFCWLIVLDHYCGVLSKWECFITVRAAFLAPILPRVMEEGESKKAALILIRHYGTAISVPFCAIVCRKISEV